MILVKDKIIGVGHLCLVLKERLNTCLLRKASLLLFVFGICLLTAGLNGIVNAQINPPEKATEQDPPGANGGPPQGAQNFLPQPAFGLPPQPAFTDVTPEQAINVAPENLDADFDDTLIRNSTGNLFRLIEGAFGALIMVVAGIGAIIAAAVGNYKLAYALIVVAVGAFILRALVSLFFGTNYEAYDVQVQVGNI
jgi:hypothetical protein